MRIKYTVDKIHKNDEGYRLVALRLGTSFAGHVTDSEPSIYPLVPECSGWAAGDKVTLPLIGLDGSQITC